MGRVLSALFILLGLSLLGQGRHVQHVETLRANTISVMGVWPKDYGGENKRGPENYNKNVIEDLYPVPQDNQLNRIGVKREGYGYTKSGADLQESLDVDKQPLCCDMKQCYNESAKNHSTCEVFGTKANCCHRNLSSVPAGLDRTIKQLNLMNNSIVELKDTAFCHYPLLECLDLAHNQLTVLHDFSFSCLLHLRCLNLWNNNLIMKSNMFPDNVFQPLVSLLTLYLNKNNPTFDESREYPDKALSVLQNLTTLHLDGLPDTQLKSGFSKMISLTKLSFAGYQAGYCKMHSLTSDMFVNVPNLIYLDISDCNIKGRYITSNSMEPLINLTELNLNHNEDIGLNDLDKIFYGLRNAKLKTLYARLVINRYSLSICLDHKVLKYFPQHLEHLEFEENNIEAVDRSVINSLSPSLRHLNLNGNKFIFGTYLRDLKNMKNLTTISLSGQTTIYHLPQVYPFQLSTDVTSNASCSIYETHLGENHPTPPFSLELPPNLTSIKMENAGLTYILSKLNVSEKNSLHTLHLKGNRFPFLEGPFYGLHSLKHLDISVSYVRAISSNFFQYMSSLEHLNLASNLLGIFFSDPRNPPVFCNLTNLRYLNLMFNDMTYLHKDALCGLDNLEILVLKRNRLVNFETDIIHLSKLENLDLSENRMTTLSVATREQLDSLFKNTTHVYLNMSFNPIDCNCHNIDFLHWMITSLAVVTNSSDPAYCVYPDMSSKEITDGYNKTIQLLDRECASNTTLFFIVGSCSLAMLCFILGAVVYRLRWKLRYLYHAAYLFYKSGSPENSSSFRKDAFVCYAEEDLQFILHSLVNELEDRDLKLLIHNRDFTAGEFITTNIVKSVQQSRKTVVVLTKALLDSSWCRLEVQMANAEAVFRGRNVLIFLLVESIPRNKLGTELLYYIKSNTYIEYPIHHQDSDVMRRFWDKLASDITN